MPLAIQVLSQSRHQHLRWHRFTSYAFTADRNLVAVAKAEIAQAALALPLTFVVQQGQWSLCALLGLTPGQNLYIAPQGNWIAAYVPASLRGHPFHLGWDETGAATLCIDEASGLLTENSDGEPFFDEAGNLSEPVAQVWSFLGQAAGSLLELETASGVLAKAGVIEPWPISITTEQGDRVVEGLHRISEAALNALSDEAFGELRRAGALAVVYAQLLSMGNLSDLGRLAQMRAEADAAERARAEVKPMIMLPEDSSIDWDWSKIGKT